MSPKHSALGLSFQSIPAGSLSLQLYLQVFLSRPLLLLPCGFQTSTYLVVLDAGSLSVTYPAPLPSSNLFSYCLISCSLPQILVPYSRRLSDGTYSSKTGVNKRLYFLLHLLGGSPCLTSIQQDRFDIGANDSTSLRGSPLLCIIYVVSKAHTAILFL